jgi:hypothetical protein
VSGVPPLAHSYGTTWFVVQCFSTPSLFSLRLVIGRR